MDKKAFRVNKKALMFVGIFSFIAGFIFPANRSETEGFFSTDLIFKSLIIAMIGGSVVTLVSYINYKKAIRDKDN